VNLLPSDSPNTRPQAGLTPLAAEKVYAFLRNARSSRENATSFCPAASSNRQPEYSFSVFLPVAWFSLGARLLTISDLSPTGMARRKSQNVTGISRIEGIDPFSAWVGFTCLKCGELVAVKIGNKLIAPSEAYEKARWPCHSCGYVHHSRANLPPWKNWPAEHRRANSLPTQRFWQGFFRICTENAAAYWKRCNVCSRIQPFQAFSRHVGWGPLALQMECRSCKGAINAVLNPKRTKEQLHESALRRRVADLLMEGENQKLPFAALFERFGHRCFKTGVRLDINARSTWAVDHILPSRYLYPLTTTNACLLSREANQNKKARWPSEFFTNAELIKLAEITGADLRLLASPTPIVNDNIDVDRCVTRFLSVRQNTRLADRIDELRAILKEYNLVKRLSLKNRRMLGL